MKIERCIILMAMLLLFGTAARGQIYPVTAHVQLNSPTSTYLTEFTTLGSDRLSVNLFLNDFNEPSYDVRLKISIEGNGISLVTNPSYTPPMITLNPGGNLFSGSDLSNYLSTRNMLINGITPRALQQGGAGLPEGLYTFCVQVVKYSGAEVALSHNHCSTKFLRKNYPPNMVSPACGSTVPVFAENQDVLFQWNSNADLAIQAHYELSIVEVPTGMNPDDAMNGTSTKILDAEPVMGTTFLYGLNQLPLEIGKKYAYRVKASDLQGNTSFENKGLSPVCTFYYGVQSNGMVPLSSPALDARVSVTQQMTFRWDRPANALPGQQVYYKLKVVKVLPDQAPDMALKFNPVWFEMETPVLPSNSAQVLPASVYPLPAEEHYAWEVKAYSKNNGIEQEVAISEKRTFASAPAVEKFKAGNPDPNMITVYTLTKNEDIADNKKRISGTGRMQIRENGQEVELHFNDIIVGPYQDFWQLDQGVIIEPLTNFLVHLDNSGKIDGAPDDMDNYGRADFDATHVIVEKDELKLRGKVKWKFPHATMGGAPPVVQSEEKVVLYNKYEIIEIDIDVVAIAFDLLDPYGFRIEYFASSTSSSNFAIYKNILTLTLDGGMTTSTKVQNTNNQRINYHFKKVDNPYYFMSTDVESDDDFRVAKSTFLQVNPRIMTFDLSEDQSPGGVADAGWKGMYFDDFVLRLPTNFDGSGQVKISDEIQLPYKQSTDDRNICLVDVNGLNLSLFHHWEDDGPSAVINTFESNFSSILFDVNKNQVTESSYISGVFGLPFLSPSDYFQFILDVTDNGIQDAYLDEDGGLEGYNFVLNEDNYVRTVSVTVKQAVLANRNHIRMTIDLDWPALGIELTNIPNFKVWGNNNIGFNTPNGSQNLPSQANGFLPGNQTFEYTVDKVSAVFDEELDLFGFVLGGSTSVAENLTGASKEPRMNIGSVKVAGQRPSIHEPENALLESQGKLFGGESVSYFGDGSFRLQLKANLGPTIGFNALVMYQPDDEEWGDVFFGLFDADFGIPLVTPATYQLLFQFICGKKPTATGAFSYWFLEFGMGSIEKSTATKQFQEQAKAAYGDLKKGAKVAKAGAASALDKAGESIGKLSDKLSAKMAELRATDPNAEPGKYARLKNSAKALASKLKVQSDKLSWIGDKLFTGSEKTKNGSALASDKVNAVDKTGAWSQRLKDASSKLKQKAGAISSSLGQKYADFKGSTAYQGLGSLANDAKSSCSSVASSARNAGSWAGGKIKKGATYASAKFKKGAASVSQKAKKGYSAGKAKAKSIKDALPSGIPMGPILLTGVQGRFYHHMSHDVTNGIIKGVAEGKKTAEDGSTDPTAYEKMTIPEYPESTSFTYLPDENTVFGLMLMANVESNELPISGKAFRGYGAFEIAFNNGGGLQSLGIEVEGGIVNIIVPIIIDKSLARGYLNIGYHAPEQKFRAQGFFLTETNALCGVGDFDFTFTPTKKLMRIASQERKAFFLPGCIGFYGLGYMDYQETGVSTSLEVGVGLGWQASYRQEINLLIATVTPYASLGLEMGLSAKVQIAPVAKLEKFGAWMSAWARVGVYVEWPWPVPNTDIGIGATLAGQVDIFPGSPWRAAGKLNGTIEVIGLDFPFGFKFDVDIKT